MSGYQSGLAGPDVGHRRTECGGDRVGFRRGGQVDGGVRKRQLRFGHSDQRDRLCRRDRDRQRRGVGHPDVLAGQNHQPARKEPRIFAGHQHSGQVVQGRVDVGAPDRLDEGADHVVVLVAVAVVAHRGLV